MSRIGIVSLLIMALVAGVVIVNHPAPSNAQDSAIQTYTSPDGSFSFDYPAAWELQENSDGTLTLRGVDALSPSGELIQLDIVQPESAIDPATNVKETPEELVAAFQQSEFASTLQFTDITRTSVGDKAAAFTTAPGSLNASTLDFFFIAIDMSGDDAATILGQTVAGELPIYQATILSIAGSFRLNVAEQPPTPTPTEAVTLETGMTLFETADGSFRFSYPDSWALRELEESLEFTFTDLASPSGAPSQIIVSRPEIVTDDTSGAVINVSQAFNLLIDLVLEGFQEDGTVGQVSEITSISLSGKETIYVTIDYFTADNIELDALLMVIGVGADNIVAITGAFPGGEFSLYEAQILTVVESMTYTPSVVVASPEATPSPAITEPSLVTVNVSPVETLTATYQTLDGTFSFRYLPSWILTEGAGSVVLQVPDPANPALEVASVEVTRPQSAYVLDYSGTGSAFGVLESFKSNLVQNYIFSNTLVTEVGGKRLAFATSSVQYTATTPPRDIMFAVVEVGGNNVALVYLETPQGQLNTFQPDVYALASTMTSTIPPATPVQPPLQPTSVPVVGPQPTVEGGATITPQPPPDVAQPERANGRVVLFYSNGTMTIYNSSDTPVSIDGLELVTPDGTRRFISRDYGFYFQRVFAPDRCVHIHLIDQPFSAPSFCRRTGTRQLTYIFGDRDHLYFVWHAGFNASGTFLVQRMGETLATCSIAAGECEFQAPITYIPYERW